MGITYFKRFRMELDLRRPLPLLPPLPSGYGLVPWTEALLVRHVDAKFRSFRDEMDAHVFPSLGTHDGCHRLMEDIANRSAFVPQATWLLEFRGAELPENCGTVQGLRETDDSGSVQNLGIVPRHRGQGLGTHLLFQALAGFRAAGLQLATLDVTAENTGALRLYERLGFRRVRTLYKAAEVAYA